MTNPYDLGWGDPYVAGWESHNIVSIHAGGVTVRVHRELGRIFTWTLDHFSQHYNLASTKDDSGYNRRPIRGYEDEWKRTHDFDYLSIHSWGGAVDLNALANPMTADPKAHHQFVGTVVHPLIAHFRGRMQWGGDFEHRQDYMHVQWVGSVRDARVITEQMGL